MKPWLTPFKLGLMIVIVGVVPAAMAGTTFARQGTSYATPNPSTRTGLGPTPENTPTWTTAAPTPFHRTAGPVIHTTRPRSTHITDVNEPKTLNTYTASPSPSPSKSKTPSPSASVSTSSSPVPSDTPTGNEQPSEAVDVLLTPTARP